MTVSDKYSFIGTTLDDTKPSQDTTNAFAAINYEVIPLHLDLDTMMATVEADLGFQGYNNFSLSTTTD